MPIGAFSHFTVHVIDIPELCPVILPDEVMECFLRHVSNHFIFCVPDLHSSRSMLLPLGVKSLFNGLSKFFFRIYDWFVIRWFMTKTFDLFENWRNFWVWFPSNLRFFIHSIPRRKRIPCLSVYVLWRRRKILVASIDLVYTLVCFGILQAVIKHLYFILFSFQVGILAI